MTAVTRHCTFCQQPGHYVTTCELAELRKQADRIGDEIGQYEAVREAFNRKIARGYLRLAKVALEIRRVKAVSP